MKSHIFLVLVAVLFLTGCNALPASTQQQIANGAAIAGQVAPPVAGAVGTAATQPGARPIDIVGAGAKVAAQYLPEPYHAAAELGLTLLALLFAKKAKDTKTAMSATTTALQAQAISGGISVTPAAVAAVNDAVPSHPETDKLVDVLANAAKIPTLV